MKLIIQIPCFNEEKTKYLFLVGEKKVRNLDLGKLIYSNNQSNQYCFRVY